MEIVGIGSDIVECLRIGRMIEQHGELFLTRVYTAREMRHCQERMHATEHFAGRWAAKEAVLKALGTGWRRGIGWRDIEIRNDRKGAPQIHLRGGARDIMERAGIRSMHVTISHCRSYAVAYVVAEN